MKLVRYGEAGKEAPGLLDAQGVLRDASALVADWGGAAISPEKLAQVRSQGAEALPVVEGSPRLGCPIAKVGKFVCVGLNYADHAAETGAATPAVLLTLAEREVPHEAAARLERPQEPLPGCDHLRRSDAQALFAAAAASPCRAEAGRDGEELPPTLGADQRPALEGVDDVGRGSSGNSDSPIGGFPA